MPHAKIQNTALQAELLVAVIRGDASSVIDHLSQGVDPNFSRGYTSPLHEAVKAMSVQLIHVLVDGGAEIHGAGTTAGWTPLHRAAGFENPAMALALLERGANVNAVTSDAGAWTPLHKAAMMGFRNTALALLRGGADMHTKDGEGDSSFDLATKPEIKELFAAWAVHQAARGALVETVAIPSLPVAHCPKFQA